MTKSKIINVAASEHDPSADFTASLSLLQGLLTCGDLTESDRAIQAASLQCVTQVDERALTVSVLRRKLMSGHYHEWEDPEGIWQRAAARWNSDRQINALDNALRFVAGWSEAPYDAESESFQCLLSFLISPADMELEVIYTKLAAVGQAAEKDLALLKSIASVPLDKETFISIGERILPPSAEAVLAELWIVNYYDKPYPRAKIITLLASTEEVFMPVAHLIQFFEALQNQKFQEARQISDAFFAEHSYNFWLRSLPFLLHFGSTAQVSAIPRRLRTLFRDTSEFVNMQSYSPLLQQTIPFIAGSFQVWWDEALRAMPTLVSDTVSHELLSKGLSKLSQDDLPFWSASGSSSPGLTRFFSVAVAVKLSGAAIDHLSILALQQAHEFTQVLLLASTHEASGLGAMQEYSVKVIDCWVTLSIGFRNQPVYQAALLSYLRETKRLFSLAEIAPLLNAGLATTLVSALLSNQSRLEMFLAMPSRDNLRIIESIPKGDLSPSWLLILDAALQLRSEWPGDQDVERLIKRLCAKPDLPAPRLTQDPEMLQRVADRLDDQPLDDLLLSVSTKIALRAGYSSQLETALKVLNKIRGESPEKMASVLAHLWLKTGCPQYFEPIAWAASTDAWAVAARCWENMLYSTNSDNLPAYPQDEKLPPALQSVFDALSSWLLVIKSNLVLTVFDNQELLDSVAKEWAIIQPCASIYAGPLSPDESKPMLLPALLEASRSPQLEHAGAASAVLVSFAASAARTEYAAITLAKTAADCPLFYEKLILQCRGILSPLLNWQLRKSLINIGQNDRAKELNAIASLGLSASTKKEISLPLCQANEKAIRLALQRASPGDFAHPQYWLALADFLRSNLFLSCSREQWKMIAAIREKVRELDQSPIDALLLVLEESDRALIEAQLFLPLKPILIDSSNFLYDSVIHGYFADPLDFIKVLWQQLDSAGFYPILTYIDKKGTHNFPSQQHLKQLIDENKIKPTTGLYGDPSKADYQILSDVAHWFNDISPLILTNDDYGKLYNPNARPRDPNGWTGHPDFPWFNERTFAAIWARLSEGNSPDTWNIHMPDKKQLTIRMPYNWQVRI